MRFLIRQVTLVCVFLFATLLFAGCSQTGRADPSPAPMLEPDAEGEPHPLIIWHALPPSESNALQHIADRFGEARPDIDVRIVVYDSSILLSEYETAVMEGAGPDILLGPPPWISALAAKGLIQPLSLELSRLLDNILPLSLARSTYLADAPYGVPYSVDFATLYYNRALMNEPPQIWDQVAPIARQSGLTIAPTFWVVSGLYLTPGGQLLTAGESPLAPSHTVKTFLAELQTLARQPGVTFTGDVTAFAEGKTGMLLSSSIHYADLRSALGDNLGVAALPRWPPKQWSTLLEFVALMQNLNSTTETIEATTAFAEFLLSPDVQQAWFEQTGHAPVNPSGLADESLRAAWTNTLEWGVAAPLDGLFEMEIQPALDRAIWAVTHDNLSAEDAAANLLASLEKSDSP